jgi:hypothetical protein
MIGTRFNWDVKMSKITRTEIRRINLDPRTLRRYCDDLSIQWLCSPYRAFPSAVHRLQFSPSIHSSRLPVVRSYIKPRSTVPYTVLPSFPVFPLVHLPSNYTLRISFGVRNSSSRCTWPAYCYILLLLSSSSSAFLCGLKFFLQAFTDTGSEDSWHLVQSSGSHL